MNRRVLIFAISFTAACAIEADPESGNAAPIDAEDREAIPICDADKELSTVQCKLALTGTQPTASCSVVLAGVNPDGSTWATAKVAKADGCDCEWTPPNKVGNATATCEDLDDDYATPAFEEGTCTPLKQTTGWLIAEKTRSAATYAEAEADALAACEVAAQQRCTMLCLIMKKTHTPATQPMSCCVPRENACADDEPCDTDGTSSTDESGDAPPEPTSEPTPEPDDPLPP